MTMQIWCLFGAALWVGSSYFFYSMGWWHGSTHAYNETARQMRGDT
jgi:hypothetical protein